MEIKSFHAHVYYNVISKNEANLLRKQLEANFDVELGRWRDKPVGPHTQPMYQVKFEHDLFSELVPWLSLNHRGLSVLIHPLTGNDLADHTEYALWLGPQLPIREKIFKERP